jgi:MerR family mercuric resistance operon transcriptional regulator
VKVSELARRAGVAPSAIRFYEAEGVLPRAARSASGYREYDDVDLCRLRVVVSLRSLGLDLHEAGRLASMCGDGRCDDMAVDLLPRIVARRLEVADARAELDHLDAELATLERTLRSGATQPIACFDVERSIGYAACDPPDSST